MTPTVAHIRGLDPDTIAQDSVVAPMLDWVREASGGRLLNMHKQVAVSPAVCAQYTSLRRAMTHVRIDERARAAAAVAVSAIERNEYTLAVNRTLARRVGWTDERITAIADGRASGDAKVDALLGAAREVARDDGSVPGSKWLAALDAGWTVAELTDVYAVVALVVFCDRFVRYAGTEADVAFDRAERRTP
jgi:hypothetical protein